jgi:hypothetical protein
MQFWRLWEFRFACVVLVLNAFCAIVYGRLIFAGDGRLALRYWLLPALRVYMCVSTVLLIPAFIAPVYISRYILRETKA